MARQSIGAGEDVTAETDAYTDLLTDLETAIDALPDAGGSGGGSVETCVVSIQHTGMIYGFNLYSALCYEEDAYVWKSEADVSSYNINIENVVIGSVITVDAIAHATVSCTGAVEIAASSNSSTRSFRITAAADEVAFIMFND